MRTNPIEHKFGHPKPYPVTFGIYKGTRMTGYGACVHGEYKNYLIDVYTARENGKIKTKLFYVTDNLNKYIKSKLVYFDKDIKKLIKGQRK